MNDLEKIKRGEKIAEILRLRKSRDFKDRYSTTWGTKTALGIYETVKRLISEEV